jgi:hypothetical protein
VIDERWRRIKEVFHAAAEQPLTARDAFVDAAPGIDEDMRHEVRSLLRSDASDDSEFDRLPLVATAMFDDVLPGAPLATGSRVGVYEILALVGSGSMGDVYHARDTQLTQSRRRTKGSAADVCA